MKKGENLKKLDLNFNMSELGIKIIINIVVGIIVFVGFFIFWGRSAGWFKEGGLVYEYLRSKKAARNSKKSRKKIVEEDGPIKSNKD